MPGVFPECDGLIAAAAPCDYRPRSWPRRRSARRAARWTCIRRDARHRCPAGAIKTSQWMVAFALETEDRRMRAMQKLERKKCDLIVVNGPAAMHAADTRGRGDRRPGKVLAAAAGASGTWPRPSSGSSKCGLMRGD